jgi:hypothetical protein
MSHPHHRSHLWEWAELVDASLPDSVSESLRDDSNDLSSEATGHHRRGGPRDVEPQS